MGKRWEEEEGGQLSKRSNTLPLNKTEKSKNRRRKLWETKARRIKIRGKPKNLRKTSRRATKKKSPAISSRFNPHEGRPHRRRATMLILTLKENEKILIGDKITIKVLEIRGKQIRLGIEAPEDVLILREKLAKKEEA